MAESPQWFVRKGDKIHGPFSSKQLAQLTKDAKVDPSTDVRRGNDGRWVAAQKVKGLFAANPMSEPQSPTPATVQSLAVPTPMPNSPIVPARDPSESLPARIACPVCGEEIAAIAIKCRYCNEILDDRQQTLAEQPFPQIVSANTNTTVILNHRQKKDVGIALLLTFFFGPFGMFYSTPIGGFVMLGVWVIISILSLFIIGLFLIPFAWIAQMVWAAMACDN